MRLWPNGLRRRVTVAIVAAMGLVAAVVGFWPVRPPFLTPERCSQVRFGMTRGEVESVLGPPGDYTGGPTQADRGGGLGTGRRRYGSRVVWATDEKVLAVGFDADGRVCETMWQKSVPTDRDPLSCILWRLKRRWRRWFP
jgi:outer membrane protein assembly factor BamE (lipoprotein component of BamABCDE complex)